MNVDRSREGAIAQELEKAKLRIAELEKENARLSSEIGTARPAIDFNAMMRDKVCGFMQLIVTFERLNSNNLQQAIMQHCVDPDEAVRMMKRFVDRAYGIPATPPRIGRRDVTQ
jgi:hypothetical protein